MKVVSEHFRSSGDTYIIILRALLTGPPLKATEVLHADCEIYCAERCGAKGDSHLKNNVFKGSTASSGAKEPSQVAKKASRTFSQLSIYAHLAFFQDGNTNQQATINLA